MAPVVESVGAEGKGAQTRHEGQRRQDSRRCRKEGHWVNGREINVRSRKNFLAEGVTTPQLKNAGMTVREDGRVTRSADRARKRREEEERPCSEGR